jgi:hypothetical protein
VIDLSNAYSTKEYRMRSNQSNGDQTYEEVGEFVRIFPRGGRWYVNYQHNNRQIRRSLRTSNKKEARRRALMIEKEILAGEHKHLRRAPLIKDVVDQYLAHKRAEGRADKTLDKYAYCFELFWEVAERQKKTRISQVDVAIVDAFRAERAAGSDRRKPSSPKTIHNDTVTIRQLVNFGLRREMITEDPLKGLKIKKPKRTPQPCWTRDEVEQILDDAKSPHREPLVFLAETGTRVGEANGSRGMTLTSNAASYTFVRRMTGSQSRATSASFQ